MLSADHRGILGCVHGICSSLVCMRLVLHEIPVSVIHGDMSTIAEVCEACPRVSSGYHAHPSVSHTIKGCQPIVGVAVLSGQHHRAERNRSWNVRAMNKC